MDYKNGKIYKLVSDFTEKIYIGSTCSPLSKRHYQHIKAFNTGKNRCTSVELLKLGKTRIELIEDFACERKEQLYAREGYFIKLNKDICANKVIEGRTRNEYINDKKEIISQNWKDYYTKNKDKLKEKRILYIAHNKKLIAEQKKKHRAEKITCECGDIITLGAKFNHLKTKKHSTFIQLHKKDN